MLKLSKECISNQISENSENITVLLSMVKILEFVDFSLIFYLQNFKIEPRINCAYGSF